MKTKQKSQAVTWIIVALLLGFSGLSARAQYTIDWSTIDGGGGTSTGSTYSVSGTIGQPDAGTMSGGQYAIQGGFWGVITVVQTPGAPLLTLTQTNRIVTIAWPLPATGFMLEQTNRLANVTNAWSSVAPPYQTNASQIFITLPLPTAGNSFYRLHKPTP